MPNMQDRPFRVTITGADDGTPIGQLVSLSERFPFVEWGILVSVTQQGSPRFPGAAWMREFAAAAHAAHANVSVHLCGGVVRRLLAGANVWHPATDWWPVLAVAQRVQINTHAEPHAVNAHALTRVLQELPGKQFIFQRDLVNDGLAGSVKSAAAAAPGSGVLVDVACLFDTSGGAGVLPDSWPAPVEGIPCGYAGGLGADNVIEQIAKIEEVCPWQYWIDMERRVRSHDDQHLLLNKVQDVLSQVATLKRARLTPPR